MKILEMIGFMSLMLILVIVAGTLAFASIYETFKVHWLLGTTVALFWIAFISLTISGRNRKGS